MTMFIGSKEAVGAMNRKCKYCFKIFTFSSPTNYSSIQNIKQTEVFNLICANMH